MEKFIPEWFEEWFNKKFPEHLDPYKPICVALTLNIDKNIVYRAILNGELEAIKISTGRWLIPRDALRKWLLERYVLNISDEILFRHF